MELSLLVLGKTKGIVTKRRHGVGRLPGVTHVIAVIAEGLA